ncbi:complement C1q domain-containing protein [Dyadobacter chenhuakuii]|uniref:Complement C1q domain-containing protein n=1 Tax=Dyadobacter chenhuakuii TaxID=2909339 RepID=A0A9X1Q8N3_9BACT|nr:complement C1q domain-containing protein [Dyadobacter chenhuakuii]MCF2497175.1 complement C1q domain-containing protein [Dyadobacter chenhuakuii]
MKKLFIVLVTMLFGRNACAQSVGINTNSPHPSSVLDISSTTKGVLFPKISLQSATDKITIPSPANALLVYNTNTQMGTEGLYYNSGDSNNPFWRIIGSKLSFPFSQTGSSNVALFYVANSGNSQNSIAISGSSEVIGVRGASDTGIGVSGTSSSGVGVLASSTSGLALHVSGSLKIAGNGQSPGQGKILTSDANGNATWQAPAVNIIAFSELGIGGGGNINSSGGLDFVTVNFGNIAYNHGGDYNPFADSFLVPFNGIYHFDAMVEWTHGDPSLQFSPSLQLVRFRGNDLTELALDFKYNVSSKYTSTISIDCQLQQGDIVFVRGKSGVNGVELETSNSTAHFNGRMLQKL